MRLRLPLLRVTFAASAGLFVSIVAALQSKSGFTLTSLSPDVALRIASLTALPDIHDRRIVAEALETGDTIITRDQAITVSGLMPVMW